MSSADFQLRGIDDARLAVHATSSQPTWLWSADGSRILWANPVGAKLFGARNGAALAQTALGPADPHRRQLMQLSGRLPPNGAVRLERLRGFGAPLGSLATCACSRLEFADGEAGILVVAAAPPGHGMPLVERLQKLVEGIDTPIAAYASDGVFVGASAAARALHAFHSLADSGLDHLRNEALKDGRVETPVGFGHMVLQRVGSGADIGLVALIAPDNHQIAPPAEDIATSDITPAATPATHADRLSHMVEVAGADPALVPEALIEHAAEVEHAIQDETSAEHPEKEGANKMVSPTVAPDRTESEDSVQIEAAIADTIAHADAAAPPEQRPREPSPFVEAVADESVVPPDSITAEPRAKPLRFLWQMDADGRFSLGTDEFTRLLGPRTAATFGRNWNDIAQELGLDPDGRIAKAIGTRATWSGIMLQWPVDGGTRLPVELSGLPVIDRTLNFAGYRGFGICRDLEALDALAAQRLRETPGAPSPHSLSADVVQAGPVGDRLDEPLSVVSEPSVPEQPSSIQPDTAVETPINVVPFRPGDQRSPVLTPVENSAFNELARQLSARLEAETGLTREPEPSPQEAEELFAQLEDAESPASGSGEFADDHPGWLSPSPLPARGEMMRDKILLDLMPVGVLIYRLDRLLYANSAFLARVGYKALHALEDAGGLDALYVEPDVSSDSSTSDGGTAVTISAGAVSEGQSREPNAAKLFAITWDGEPAHALIFSSTPGATTQPATTSIAAAEPVQVGHADAEDLAVILDTTAEGVVMFDAQGNINSCNRSAEALFGYDGDMLTKRNLIDLFAHESQRVVRDYLESIKGSGVASLLDHGREALGQVRAGGLFPVSIMMGRTREGGPNFFAVFRDLTQTKKTETELLNARRQADRAATAKADVLARISHEVRTPLNAIIGFAEVMTDERFGPLGNERYAEYMKDIRASGERVIAIINDLLDLSRIESGKLDLAFTNQNLNEMVEQCVAVMQPQANRGRIIIRTSLAHLLPTVVADARALRQIALNLIGNSIHLANAGGQVIVSTALNDFGEVVLRVRDTGHGMNDNELAAALEPFHSQAPADHSSENAGVSLSLTKALVEANRARFQIKTAPSSGTLIEVLFSHAATAKA